MRLSRLFFLLSLIHSSTFFAQTETKELDLWKFSKGENKAACNGDANSLELFHKPSMKVFNGKLVFWFKNHLMQEMLN